MSDPSIDILSSFIKQLLSGVLRVVDPAQVRAVFAGGSVAGGEVSFRVEGSVTEFYSDVDLYVVVRDESDLEKLRTGCNEAITSIPLKGDNFRFFREPDVGVYTFDSLADQPARPGTVGLDKSHMMLYGDKAIPGLAAKRIGEQIEREESLYLLENRLLELSVHEVAAAGTDGQDTGFSAFMTCKTCMDVVTASLIARGQYEPGRSKRLRRLLAIGLSEDVGWTDQQVALATRCENSLHKMPSPQWAESVVGERTWDEVIALALDIWKQLAAEGTSDWSSMLLRRCRNGEYLRNFREFRALNTRRGFRRRGGLVSGAGLSRYSPVETLRLSALIDYLDRYGGNRPETAAIKRSIDPYLDKLTRICGFGEGTLIERSFRMYRAL